MKIKTIPIWFVIITAAMLSACGTAGTDQAVSEEKEISIEKTAIEDTTGQTTGRYENETDSVMSYEEFMSAELSQEVVIDCFVQDKLNWENGKASLFAQDKDGGYYLYHAACSEEDYALLTPGKKIRVTGYKGIFQGRIEIEDAVFEILEGRMIAEAADLTECVGDADKLADFQNRKVCFHDLVVLPMDDGSAFYYDWDNSGDPAGGKDLYFKAGKRDKPEDYMTFSVELDLCGETSEVYQTVQLLKAGDPIEVEAFLFWYARPLPLVTELVISA